MTEEPIDLTPYIKSFKFSLDTGLKSTEPQEVESDVYFWSFGTQTTTADINFTVEPGDIPKLMELEGEKLMSMEQKGKYWFDKGYTADVRMTDLQIADDGTITATYIGTNITDLTNRSLLARFLRWLLRR